MTKDEVIESYKEKLNILVKTIKCLDSQVLSLKLENLQLKRLLEKYE